MKRILIRRRLAAVAAASAAVLAAGTVASAQMGVGPFTSNTIPPAPSGPAPAPPANATYHASTTMQALAMLAWQTRGTNGALSGRCATLNGVHYCVPEVMVDGQTISDVSLVSELVGLTTAPAGPGATAPAYTAGTPAATTAATSEVVLSHLLATQAKSDGLEATEAQAAAEAQRELTAYQQTVAANPAAAAGVLPPGADARAYFTDPRTIAAYQVALSIGNERRKLERAAGIAPPSGLQSGPNAGYGQQLRAVYAAFLAHQLTTHQVRINGAPPTEGLAQALPATP